MSDPDVKLTGWPKGYGASLLRVRGYIMSLEHAPDFGGALTLEGEEPI